MNSHAWLSKLSGNPIDWLLSCHPWTKHMTLIDLLEEPRDSHNVSQAKKELEKDPLVLQLIDDAGKWFSIPPKRHDDSKMSHYQLKMLADFGFNESDPGIGAIMEMAMRHVENGTFSIKQGLPEKGAGAKIGSDFDEWHSLPCDSPVISSTLYRLGNRSEALMKSIEIIQERWNAPGGWFCHLFFVESQYKKHKVGCMMAGLEALELFSLFSNTGEEEFIKNAFVPLQYHKDYGKSLYYFGRSKRFWTFKYPFVWYNALYLADILSRFAFFKNDILLKEIIDWILASQDEDGRFRPTSMFMNYKNWDFADKKANSPWITFLCCRILKQYYS